MLTYALRAEITEEQFYNMSIPEVNRQIQAWGWRLNTQYKHDAQMIYVLPTLIGAILSSADEYPEIEEVFPSIFRDEKEEMEKQKQIQHDKAQANKFMAFARQFNERFKKNKENK